MAVYRYCKLTSRISRVWRDLRVSTSQASTFDIAATASWLPLFSRVSSRRRDASRKLWVSLIELSAEIQRRRQIDDGTDWLIEALSSSFQHRLNHATRKIYALSTLQQGDQELLWCFVEFRLVQRTAHRPQKEHNDRVVSRYWYGYSSLFPKRQEAQRFAFHQLASVSRRPRCQQFWKVFWGVYSSVWNLHWVLTNPSGLMDLVGINKRRAKSDVIEGMHTMWITSKESDCSSIKANHLSVDIYKCGSKGLVHR